MPLPMTVIMPIMFVKDLEAASAWYEKVWGRPANRELMGSVREWTFDGNGIQVFQEPDKAGQSEATVGVKDLAVVTSRLENRGLLPDNTIENDQFLIAIYKDPDGNELIFSQELEQVN